MAVFVYKGFDTAGRTTSGIVDADSARLARVKLRKSGVFPTDLSEERQQAATLGGTEGILRHQFSFRQVFARVTETDKAILTRQLATLIGAGIPVVESLSALIDQVENPLIRVAVGQVRQRVNEGASLAEAMAQHPKVFSSLYVNMIKAGEAGGALEVVLDRLADYMESQVRLRNRVSAAMVYPMVMSGMAVLFIGVLVTFVVPKLTEIFKSINQPLPFATVLLIKLSDFMKAWWWAVIAVGIGVGFAFRRWKESEKGRSTWDRFVLRVPLVGKLARTVAVARFSKTLATLLSSGIPLIRSLEIVRNIMDNEILATALDQARESITEGASIAQPLRLSGQFPPMLIHMIAIGEKSGELEAMLGKVAEAYDNEVETTIAKLTSWLEPVMILVMAIVVGAIIVSILIPIFNINQVIA